MDSSTMVKARAEQQKAASIVPQSSLKMFSRYPAVLKYEDQVKLERVTLAINQTEALKKRADDAKRLKEMRMVPKETKIMGNQATAFGQRDEKASDASWHNPDVTSPKKMQKEGDPENVFGIKTTLGLQNQVNQMSDLHVTKIPDYLETLQRDRSMKHGHVSNVAPRIKTPKRMGNDLFPAPKREANYPLKARNYPQYSPGGNNISTKHQNAQQARVQMHQQRKDEEADFNLAEYEKTMIREMERAQKKMTGTKKFIDVSNNTSPAWRRTSRAHHNEIKWRDDEMRSPRATRYSPNYEPVQAKLQETGALFGTSKFDRWNPNDMNSPLYLQPAAGQGLIDGTAHICERTDPDYFRRITQEKASKKAGMQAIPENNQESKLTDKRSSTIAKDRSYQSIFAQTAYKRPFESNSTLQATGGIGINDQSKKTLGSRNRSIGLTHNLTNGSNVSLRLPELSELKTQNSYFIANNPNKTTRAYDFMGYPKRKEIYEGFPEPHEKQFIMPEPLCTLASSKHKYTPNIDIGSYSNRASLFGENKAQTPVKEILNRVGQQSPPAYAKEYQQSTNYKIFVHKPETEAAKAEKRRALMDDTIQQVLDGFRPDPEDVGKSVKEYASVDKKLIGKVKNTEILKELEYKNLEKTAAAATKDEPLTF